MTEVEKLVLEVESRGLAQVNSDLSKAKRNVDTATSGFSKFSTSLKAAGLAAVAVGTAVVVVGKKVVDATKDYQDFIAQLETSTKSAQKAVQAYQAIEDFAATTPFSVGEATDAFVKLVNLGLTPSERALRSYGNVASSFKGKSLQDFIEAVADAATGEYERLKEFGIKASKDGEQVTFAFQGIRTTVAATSAEIEKYLTGLGENQFAGAMEKRMRGLSGVLSNLDDAWTRFLVNVGNQGPASLITRGFQAATSALDELNAQLKSGEFEQNTKAFGILWGGIAEDAAFSLNLTTQLITEAVAWWGQLLGAESRDDAIETFRLLPIYARGATELIAAYFVKMVDDWVAHNEHGTAQAKINWDGLVEKAKIVGRKIKEFLTLGIYQNPDDFNASLKAVDAETAKRFATSEANLKDQLQQNENVFASVMEQIGAETNARTEGYQKAKQEALDLRKTYEEATAARKAKGGDQLAEFKVGGDGKDTGPSKAAQKAAEDAAKFSERLMEDQVRSVETGALRSEQVILESYERRKAIILENEALTEEQKKSLILAALSESIVSETEAIRRSYDERRQFILSATSLTEQQKTELMTNLTKAREESLRQIEQRNMDQRLSQASEFFGNIASIGTTFGKKGFQIAKAAAIAQATIDTYKAATGAYASLASIPYVGPALGAAAAAAAIVAGTARIAQIKSQEYSGAYAQGGMVPAGKYGLVGEAGPELVRGPAIVTSAATTAAKGDRSGVKTVTVQNYGAPVAAESKQNGDELLVILRPLLEQNKAQTKAELTDEISRGGGKFGTQVERTYGLRRSQTV